MMVVDFKISGKTLEKLGIKYQGLKSALAKFCQ